MQRRRFLLGVGSGLALWVAGAGRGLLGAAGAEGPFGHGVASGDPLTDAVVLWTRVTTDAAEVPVQWTVARDPHLEQVVAQGTAAAVRQHDHTVHVDVGGLAAGTTYWYRFDALGASSPVGRTRTAPSGSPDRVQLAVASCADYQFGFYHAFARMAERPGLDAVVFLGDYIYESADVFQGYNPMGRHPDPVHALFTLDDYRRRYAQTRSDPDLQAAHAAHPWIVVWDDHEFVNNCWRHGPGSAAEWAERSSAAMRAWWEWMPVRPDPSDDPTRIWRGFRFGDLVDLAMLDTRFYGRQQPATDTGLFGTPSNDPARELIGPEQMGWLLDRMAGADTRWRLVGNQVMMAPHTYAAGLPHLPPDAAEQAGIRQGGNAEGNDNWNAYTAERARLFTGLREREIHDVVVLSGDVHSAWAADLVEDPYDPTAYDPLTGDGSLGTEVVCHSVTSVNVGDVAPEPTLTAANLAVECENPNVKYTNLGEHGYVVIDATPDRLRAEWWNVDNVHLRTVRVPGTGERRAASLLVEPGADHGRREGVPVPGCEGVPAL